MLTIRMKKLLFHTFFIVVYSISFGQTFHPEIENYTIANYKADNQNWGIDIDSNGVVYVANNKGLLRYNGQSWQLYELPNKTIVRSVLCVKNRIYTGSYEEFGFWEKDIFGNYEYTSLVPSFDANHQFKNEQFWKIIEYKDRIVFESFAGGIYIYDGNQIQYVEDSLGVYDIAIYEGKLIVANRNKGIQELKENELLSFEFSEREYTISSVNNLAVISDKLFFFDLNEGGFIYDSDRLLPLPEEVNLFLNTHVLNKAVFLDEENLAIGTIKNGIIIYNLTTKTIQYINKESGLQNNTVLGLKVHEGNLWAALDNGLGKIDFKTPFSYYKDFTGTVGTVYDVAFLNEKYYLASNTGIYTYSNDKKLQFIEGSEGQVWDLSIIENQIIAGHNDGSFLIENNRLSQKLTSGGVYCTIKVPGQQNWYLQGTYYGINLLKKNVNNWSSYVIENLSFLVNDIVFESNRIIWVTHSYKGVFRIELNENYTKAIQVTSYGENKNFKQYQTNIFKIDSDIVFYNSGKWFQYFQQKDSIGSFKKFKDFDDKVLIHKEKNEAWFIDRKSENTLTLTDSNYKEIYKINVAGIKQRLVAKYEKIIFKNDSLRMINLNDGFAMYNINALRNDKKSSQTPVIDKIYSRKKQFSIQDTLIHIPFEDAKYLAFEIYMPKSYGNDFSYTLSGEVDQKDFVKEGKLILQNLPYGNYTLSLENDNQNGENSIKQIGLKVLPPWYLSNAMKFLYSLLAMGLLFMIYKINKIKIRKQQLALQEEYMRETQKRINEIEKKNLEKEIRNKKRELTNSTLSVTNKNEMIIELRNELNRLKQFSTNEYRTKRLLDSSKKHINSNDNWKIFESNFNELHEDFFKSLISKFPKLTTKDLKLCAYIKIGLITKDIAPLLGISVRGVELQRYRLRKKLELNSSDSLSSFLMKL